MKAPASLNIERIIKVLLGAGIDLINAFNNSAADIKHIPGEPDLVLPEPSDIYNECLYSEYRSVVSSMYHLNVFQNLILNVRVHYNGIIACQFALKMD